jgi:hypothetical protein
MVRYLDIMGILFKPLTPNDLIIIIIIFINCNWVVTRWQWSFNTYTKHETGLLLNLRPEGYMRSM